MKVAVGNTPDPEVATLPKGALDRPRRHEALELGPEKRQLYGADGGHDQPHQEADWAYDRQSSIGRFNKAWDEANQRGWTVVDMKNDWKRVFAFEK